MIEQTVVLQTLLLITSLSTAVLVPESRLPLLSFLRRWRRLLSGNPSGKASRPKKGFAQIDFTDFEP